MGETNQGIDDLMLKDPLAYYDTTRNKVVSAEQPEPAGFPNSACSIPTTTRTALRTAATPR